ncbi:DUF4191 domain-containing protein [Crossiella cryophila]|uniref:DUF4191 domain-containing protein n=1 Tax=Crossiella cryophila TaxID=43355 RepID=A0A7W7C8P4_9PSEU|nr:DUF4191 domain-containing protein [Crossiella cryophila]MBB4676619.1 hypothetical protein [Crossiella cryophila]
MAPKPPKPDKATAKAASRERRAASKARRKQIFEAFKMQRREDKWLVPLMILAVLGATGVVFGIGWLIGYPYVVLPLGIAIGALIAVSIFGRRVQRNVYSKADGQPGSAAWALGNLRGKWRVTQAVAGTTQLDAVHRVLGRPGVVLVAEGAPHRVKPLIAQEKKRIGRIIGDTPIYDVIVGNETEDKQVPLRRLQSYLSKLPRNITVAQMDVIEKRLSALASRGAALPKGPLPQGAKMRNVQRTIRRR